MTQATNILGSEKGNGRREDLDPIANAEEVTKYLIEQTRQEEIAKKLKEEKAKKLQEEKDRLNPAPKNIPEIVDSQPVINNKIKSVYVDSQYQSIEDIVTEYFRTGFAFIANSPEKNVNSPIPATATEHIYITEHPIRLNRNFEDTQELLQGTPFFLPSVGLLLEHLENVKFATKEKGALKRITHEDSKHYEITQAQRLFLDYLNTRVNFNNRDYAHPTSSWLNDSGTFYRKDNQIKIISKEYSLADEDFRSILCDKLPPFSQFPYDKKSWDNYCVRNKRSITDCIRAYFNDGVRFTKLPNSDINYSISKKGYSSNDIVYFNFRFSSAHKKFEIDTPSQEESTLSDSFLCITKDDYEKLESEYLSRPPTIDRFSYASPVSKHTL